MAKCPSCKTEGAYVGFSAIECATTKCQHYSPKWHEEKLKREVEEAKARLGEAADKWAKVESTFVQRDTYKVDSADLYANHKPHANLPPLSQQDYDDIMHGVFLP